MKIFFCKGAECKSAKGAIRAPFMFISYIAYNRRKLYIKKIKLPLDFISTYLLQ